MSSYTEEPEGWRPVAISILEKAGLPTSDRHVTKLMRDLEILDLEEDWQSLVWRSIEIRNLWDETRADLLGLANAIDCVGELMLKYRHSEFARDPQTGPFLYLRDDAHRALWEMRDAARKHAQLALKESKLFDQARREGRDGNEHLDTRMFLLLRDLYMELGGPEEIGEGPLYRFVEGVIAGIKMDLMIRMPDKKVFRTTMTRAIKRPRRNRPSPFRRIP
jgi:hypothetical protein